MKYYNLLLLFIFFLVFVCIIFFIDLWFYDVLLCEDHPVNDSVEILSKDDMEEKVSYMTWYCSGASTQETHARVYYDKVLELDRKEEILSTNFGNLSSNKDIMEWCRLSEMKVKAGFSDADVKEYIANKRYSYEFKENKYLDSALELYNKIHTLIEKYPSLRTVNLDKYKLVQRARHFSLDEVRYPR